MHGALGGLGRSTRFIVRCGYIAALCTFLAVPVAQAGPLVGGRLSLTMGGNGEFDAGAGHDKDHEDMGGHAFGAVFLMPIFSGLRVGAAVDLTPDRSVRVDAIDGGGRRDFGKTVGAIGIVEYELPSAEQANLLMHMSMFGGALIATPAHEVETMLEEGEEDGIKTGFTVGLGGGITRMLGDKLGLRMELFISYERLRLLNHGVPDDTISEELQGPLNFKTLRYLLSLGVMLDVS